VSGASRGTVVWGFSRGTVVWGFSRGTVVWGFSRGTVVFGFSRGTVVQDVNMATEEIRDGFIGLVAEDRACPPGQKTASY
jgi:peptidase E